MNRSDRQTIPAEELQERIETFLLCLRRPILSEPGREFVDLAASSYSFSTQYDKLLWHIWNDSTNMVRHITGIEKESEERMELRYQKFGKGPPGSLVVADSRAGSERLERKAGRMQYALSLKRYLAQLFPEWRIEDLHTDPDLHRSLSGLYTRCTLAKGQRRWAVMGCGESEDPQTAGDILTYGLLWLDSLRGRDLVSVFEGLKLFLPRGRFDSAAQRLAGIDPAMAKCEVYETGTELVRVDMAGSGNLKTRFSIASHHPSPLAAASAECLELTTKIRGISPAIDAVRGAGDRSSFSINGLVFAREALDGIAFGVGNARTKLAPENFSNLVRLVKSIERARNSAGAPSNHPYYRLQPERWMQTQAVRAIESLGLDIDPESVYEQVPAAAGAEHGTIDLLGITSRGRMVVAEFKASDDIHLPLQALEYWLTVRLHQRRGELQELGYFPNRVVGDQPPLLALVAPALQFHSTTDAIVKYFAPEIEVVKIGLNEDWRRGIQVLFRDRKSEP